MLVESLSLTNFRSYEKQTVLFSPKVTILVGPNAVGKTNLVEALFCMATGKSFRAGTDREMIRWGSDLARITTIAGDITLELLLTMGEVEGQKTPLKRYLVNGVPRRQIDFVGNVRAVLFWPEHLELVIGSPSTRRSYMDSVLVQVDREYRRTLHSYERGLRQRNKLLDAINEGRASRSQLLFWDQLLIRAGGYITDKRSEYLQYVSMFSADGLSYAIYYDKSVISPSRLEQYKDEEVAAKATLVGPHRDDFVIAKFRDPNSQAYHVQTGSDEHSRDLILSNEGMLDLSKYGSRGEQRLAVLWLKLAELSYIQKQAGERPVLLLDDMFSELDIQHQQQVLELVSSYQTILTSANEDIASFVRLKVGSTLTIRHLPFENTT